MPRSTTEILTDIEASLGALPIPPFGGHLVFGRADVSTLTALYQGVEGRGPTIEDALEDLLTKTEASLDAQIAIRQAEILALEAKKPPK